MKYKILLIFSFTIKLVLGQGAAKKVYVEYSVFKDDLETTEYLISDKSNALYTSEYAKHITKGGVKENEEGVLEVKPKVSEYNTMKYYSSISSPLLYFVSVNPKKKLPTVAKDSVPAIKWELKLDSDKVIGGYTCYRAEGMFRGSKIIAYYTPELAIGFGPYKFKGLPGLILEAYNEGVGIQYNWRAKKVVIPFNTDTSLVFSPELYNAPVVSYRSLIERFKSKMARMDRKFAAQAPRGATTTLVKSERTSIEKVYEWEN